MKLFEERILDLVRDLQNLGGPQLYISKIVVSQRLFSEIEDYINFGNIRFRPTLKDNENKLIVLATPTGNITIVKEESEE